MKNTTVHAVHSRKKKKRLITAATSIVKKLIRRIRIDFPNKLGKIYFVL